MKLFEYATRSDWFPLTLPRNAEDKHIPKMRPVTKHYLHVYMPWKRTRAPIEQSDGVLHRMAPAQPQLTIVWYSHPQSKRAHYLQWIWL